MHELYEQFFDAKVHKVIGDGLSPIKQATGHQQQ